MSALCSHYLATAHAQQNIDVLYSFILCPPNLTAKDTTTVDTGTGTMTEMTSVAADVPNAANAKGGAVKRGEIRARKNVGGNRVYKICMSAVICSIDNVSGNNTLNSMIKFPELPSLTIPRFEITFL